MAFDLMKILSERSKEGVESKKVEIVEKEVDSLIASKDNFYSTQKLEKLKASILAFGILQPLLIRKTENGDEIIAGHCRQKCCSELVKQGHEELKTVPCIYQETKEGESKNLIDELLVMQTNTYREKTDWEKMKETIRTEEIISEIRKNMDLKGKTRDYLEGIIGVKGTQAARYKVIHNNLSAKLMEEFKTGNIGISIAYECARLSKEGQQTAYESLQTKGMLVSSDIEKIKGQEQIPGQLEFPEKEVIKEHKKAVRKITEQDKKRICQAIYKNASRDIRKRIRDCDLNMTIALMYQLFRNVRINQNDIFQRVIRFAQDGAIIEDFKEETEQMPWKEIATRLIEEYGIKKEVKIIPKYEEEAKKCYYDKLTDCTYEVAHELAEEEGYKCTGCCRSCKERTNCGYACNSSKTQKPEIKIAVSKAEFNPLDPLTEQEKEHIKEALISAKKCHEQIKENGGSEELKTKWEAYIKTFTQILSTK